MKSLFAILLFSCSTWTLRAQKPALDSSTFGKWPRLTNIQMSIVTAASAFAFTNRAHRGLGTLFTSNGKKVDCLRGAGTQCTAVPAGTTLYTRATSHANPIKSYHAAGI